MRLDCWEGHRTLRAYYRTLGFTELDAVTEQGFQVRLFELGSGDRKGGRANVST